MRYWMWVVFFGVFHAYRGLGYEGSSHWQWWLSYMGVFIIAAIIARLIWVPVFGREQWFWKKKPPNSEE